jgi:hypothetical protein
MSLGVHFRFHNSPYRKRSIYSSLKISHVAVSELQTSVDGRSCQHIDYASSCTVRKVLSAKSSE